MAQLRNFKRIVPVRLRGAARSALVKDGAVERSVGNRVARNEGKPPGVNPGQSAQGNKRSDRT